MEVGADQTLPSPRKRERPQHRAVAAADLQIAPRVREKAAGETYDQLVARHEPEMLGFDLCERGERSGIEAADGVGELGREHRNALVLRGVAAARRTMPARRPRGLLRPDRFVRPAAEAQPLRNGRAVHRASALTVTPAIISPRPSNWMAGNGSPNSTIEPIGTNTKLSAMNG